jgi:haloalkane dehalogenase
MAVDVARAGRVRGVVLGNSWFWPAADLSTKALRRFQPGRRPGSATPSWSITARCNPSRRPAPGMARMPKEILAAGPPLGRLARKVPDKLAVKPALLGWGMKDFALRPGPNLPRMRAAFGDHELVELPDAKHYIQEDAPQRITEAVRNRFG